MSAFHDNALMGASGQQGYKISRSVRLRSSASAYFNRTFGSGSRTTWTWSCWVKRGAVGVVYPTTNYAQTLFGLNDSDKIYYYEDALWLYLGTGATYVAQPTDKFRDPSAWYHVVVVLDTTNATSADRIRMYVNNRRITISQTMPTQNWASSNLNSAVVHNIGKADNGNLYYLDGYITEIQFIDGQALTPSSFGETDAVTGVWKPKKYAGTYGTNGFYLNFSDNSGATATTIGKDYSGNGNNWTPNNISVTAGVTYDSMLDVPTPYADGGNGRGNYCVMNPLDWQTTSFPITNGNLTWTSTTTASGSSRGTMGMTTGKWYWEVLATSVGSGSCGVGIAKDGSTNFGSGQALYTSNTGNKYIDGTTTAYGATWATNNMIGIAYDADAGQITFYKDNTSQGAITLSGYAGVNVCPVVSDASSLAFTLDANFGQRPFTYTPPTGFVALNTQNLPDATIKKGNAYFDATAYSGTGATQSIVNSGGMQPNLLWIKCRSSNSYHVIVDSVRGLPKVLASNAADAEAANGFVTSLNSNGFTLPANTTSDAYYTNIGSPANTFVGWQWKESVSAGFDIVTYTGTGVARTVAHSLGVAPKMVIVKNRSIADNWRVWHSDIGGANRHLVLNQTGATSTAANFFTAVPTSTAFTVGSDDSVNKVSTNLIAYCFAEVAGYSKFGSYTGNGSADGPFVFLGFRPRFVMLKASSTTGDWIVYDSSRNTYNVADLYLYPNSSAAEAGSGTPRIDFLSNGFKLRNTGQGNVSAVTFIYAAFAENPFKNSLAR